MLQLDEGTRARLDAVWRRARKAMNQWLDGDDDRHTRLVFVCGDAHGGARAVADALGSVEQAWSTEGWPVESGSLIGPDATALAAWLTPADVLLLTVPGESHRVGALLSAHPTALVAWAWRPWAEAVHATLALDPSGGRDALRALAGGGVAPGLPPLAEDARDQLRTLLGDAPGPGTCAALSWYVRHGVVASGPISRDPRVVLLPLDGGVEALAELVGKTGLAQPDALAVPPVPPQEAADVDPRVARLCDALADTLRGRARAAA